MTRRRIIIVDDHPLFRAALRQTLSGGDATVSVEEAGDLNGLSAALDAVRAAGARIRPQCPFVKRYFERHPAYADLLADT